MNTCNVPFLCHHMAASHLLRQQAIYRTSRPFILSSYVRRPFITSAGRAEIISVGNEEYATQPVRDAHLNRAVYHQPHLQQAVYCASRPSTAGHLLCHHMSPGRLLRQQDVRRGFGLGMRNMTPNPSPSGWHNCRGPFIIRHTCIKPSMMSAGRSLCQPSVDSRQQAVIGSQGM